MTESVPNHNMVEYTVSEISTALKRVVEDSFRFIRLRGEISGFKRAASGHLYMSLKDDAAVLDAVCWNGTARKFGFQPEDGLEVICTGRVTTYPGRSKYQFVIESMEPAGVGALMALLEKRKKQFEAEGLFAAERKKPLPFMPQVIGVVTSPTGAVIRDILHRLADRFPVHVLVWPVLVQGEGAAEQIANAIHGFNTMPPDGPIPRPDLLIVARGGGSLEDLWAFNEEVVVRAAANSAIPLISAVGHETDTTLIDYVSDRRAPTPTAAAEIAVPVREEWLLTLAEQGTRMQRGIFRLLEERQNTITGLVRGLPRPTQLLETAAQRLDDWAERFTQALPQLLQRKQERLTQQIAGLRPQLLLRDINQYTTQINDYATRLKQAGLRLTESKTRELNALAQLLESYHYKKVLKRGFAIVRDTANNVITAAAQTETGQSIILEFHDGKQNAAIGEAAPSAPITSPEKPVKKPRKTPKDSLQESLF